jgi:hypothetical protein
MTTTQVFQAVAAGRLSPEDAARLLTPKRSWWAIVVEILAAIGIAALSVVATLWLAKMTGAL